MSEAQIHKFIFAPGFSTAAAITSVSAAASAWTWCAPISTRSAAPSTSSRSAGEGSSVTIKIPLTLAIVSALIVEAAGDRFAIPQLSVGRAGPGARQLEHRIERIKDTAVLRSAQQAACR
jgi:two-component system chemotaxis sensor kinase CheA